MYTQCEHCKAIFRVNAREVTVAKGQLCCGECHSVFNATASLSTTMPEPYSAKKVEYLDPNDPKQNRPQRDIDIPAEPSDLKEKVHKAEKPRLIKGVETDSDNNNRWLLITALLLFALLAAQALYNYRHLLMDSNRYQPDKIQMLNHNVFTHPIEKGVLLISASIENIADYDQPFPILEVRLTNSQSKLVALRRFKPDEYLDNYSKDKLLKKNLITSLKLKIKDPGNQATRFQFNFL